MTKAIKTLSTLLLLSIIIICQRQMTVEAHERRHAQDQERIKVLEREIKLMKSAYKLKCYEAYQGNEVTEWRSTGQVYQTSNSYSPIYFFDYEKGCKLIEANEQLFKDFLGV